MSALSRVWCQLPRRVRAQLPWLISGNALMRLNAVNALSETLCPPAAEVLRDCLPDPTPMLNEAILRAILKLRSDLASDAAMDLWRCGNSEDQRIARAVLLEQFQLDLNRDPADVAADQPSIYKLLADLGGQDEQASLVAESRLQTIGEIRLLPSLQQLLVQAPAYVAPSILRVISVIDRHAALSSAHRLVWAGPTLDHCRAGFAAMVDLGRKGLFHAARVVLSIRSCDTKRTLGVDCLAHRAFDELQFVCINSVENDEPLTVHEAADLTALFVEQLADRHDALSRARKKRCIEFLIKLIKHEDPQVRHVSFTTLKKLGHPEYARDLLRESDPELLCRAINTVADLGKTDDVPWLLPHLSGSASAVRAAALSGLRRLNCPRDELRRYLISVLGAPDPHIRREACEALAIEGTWRDWRLLRPHTTDDIKSVCIAAHNTLVLLRQQDPRRRRHLRFQLDHANPSVRVKAIQQLRTGGEPFEADLVLERLNDSIGQVRAEAIRYAANLDPIQRVRAVRRMICDPESEVAQCALQVLITTLAPREVADAVIKAIPFARGNSGLALLPYLKTNANDQWPEAVRLAITSPSPAARAIAAEAYAGLFPHKAAGVLECMLTDADQHVRFAAFRPLASNHPRRALRYADRLLRARSENIRIAVLELITSHGNEAHLEHAMPLLRDHSHEVRIAALHAIARFDDPRVVGEVISAANDEHSSVAALARTICLAADSPLAALQPLKREDRCRLVERRLEQIREVHLWAKQIGRELLGSAISVNRLRQGLGCTVPPPRGGGAVPIFITDLPVASGHPQGVEIMKGLVLHELGHHLYDIGVKGSRTCQGMAKADGVKHLYDVLRDERLERALRSRRPQWGAYFDQLASYAFAQRDHYVGLDEYAKVCRLSPPALKLAIIRAQVPGRLTVHGAVSLRCADLLRLPGMTPPISAFHVCLRCGFDPRMHEDSRVTASIKMVPADLKDLNHRQVLETARRIGDLMGRDEDHQQQVSQLRRRFRFCQQILRMLDRLFAAAAQGTDDAAEAEGNPPRRTAAARSRKRCESRYSNRMVDCGSNTSFQQLVTRTTLVFVPAAHAELVASVRQHVRPLRRYLETLGQRTVDHHGSRCGQRLDLASARRSALTHQPNVLVHARDEQLPDAYLGLLIDRSGSMKGRGLELAKRFGALLVESARGLRGFAGHVSAFDDQTFYELGDLQRTTIASLHSGQGNNDAGGLAMAAELARRSRKRHRVIVMISDGSPTECTTEALRNLVDELTREGLICAQAAVSPVRHDCFSHRVDLSCCAMEDAVAEFGDLIVRLVCSRS